MVKQVDPLLTAHLVLNLATRVRSDLSKTHLDLFLVASAIISLLAIDSANMSLMPYMILTQAVLTIPFLRNLWTITTSSETRIQTRVLVMLVLGWFALRFTSGLVLAGATNQQFLLHNVLLMQGLILMQTIQLMTSSGNGRQPNIVSGIVASLSTPYLVFLLRNPWLISILLVALFVTWFKLWIENMNSASVTACHQWVSYHWLMLSLMIAAQMNATLWPAIPWSPLHPLLILATGGLTWAGSVTESVPGTVVMVLASVFGYLLLPSWSGLSVLIVVIQLWVS